MNHVCAVDVAECMRRMVVPEPEVQLWILQRMFEVRSSVDTLGLDGVFMKLFIAKDLDAVDALANALEVHSKSADVIDSIIRYSKELPIDADSIAS